MRVIKGLLVTVLLFAAMPASASCRSHNIITIGGPILICSTCCTASGCTTTCF